MTHNDSETVFSGNISSLQEKKNYLYLIGPLAFPDFSGKNSCTFLVQFVIDDVLVISYNLQITTLVNHKEQGRRSERALKAIQEIGKVVAFAVERFVSVGEQIALENEDVADEMREACEEAKKSGQTIFNLTSSARDSFDDGVPNSTDKSGMVRAARSLLSAVTRVLIIADSIVVKRLLTAVKKVKTVLCLCLNSQFAWL